MKTINDLDFDVPKDIDLFTKHSAEIAILILNFIRKEGGSKKDFAKLVGKTSSEITRWTSGSHNFTIMTLALIETKTNLEIVRRLLESNIECHRSERIFKFHSESSNEKELSSLKNDIVKLKSQIETINIRKGSACFFDYNIEEDDIFQTSKSTQKVFVRNPSPILVVTKEISTEPKLRALRSNLELKNLTTHEIH